MEINRNVIKINGSRQDSTDMNEKDTIWTPQDQPLAASLAGNVAMITGSHKVSTGDGGGGISTPEERPRVTSLNET